jgi:hypothetical protein
MEIRPVGAKLFHADERTARQTGRHDEANSRFSQICERASWAQELHNLEQHTSLLQIKV